MKLFLTFYILLATIFLGEKKNFKKFNKVDKYEANESKRNFTFGCTLDSLLDMNIGLFDTTDCVFKIFCAEKNLNHFESKATRIAQNQSEISLSTLVEVTKNDTALTSERYLNKLIGIAFIKHYKSGRIKSCGFQIGENERIGIWKYFNSDGKLDSIADCSAKQKMNFCKFFRIARAFGMVGDSGKIPERKRFIQIADSLGLTNCKSAIFSNPNWRDLDFYPVHQEEIEGHFISKIYYSLWHSNEWTVEKHFDIQGKSLCFALSIFPETNEVCTYEAFSVK